LNPVRVVGFVLAIAGVLMTSLADLRAANFAQAQYMAGNLLFLVACAASGFFNAYCKFLVERKYTELEILVYTTIVGSLGGVPLFIWIEPLPVAALLNADATAILGLLELALIVYGVSSLLFFSILKRLDVTQAALGNYLLPFFIGLLAVMVLKESITTVMLAGGTIVLVSTLMVTVYEAEILSWLRYPRRFSAKKEATDGT
jgi:drug/metabolite transporter (DMT)-like permease